LVNSRMYPWDAESTYIHKPPFFSNITQTPLPINDITDAYCLLNLGHSITTDHISPAGNIATNSPAARYLISRKVDRHDFNTYGSRRGNDEVMTKGTFANIRLINKMCPDAGPKTIHIPSGEVLAISDVADLYKKSTTPVIVLAGQEYGSGSSRDWAAKGPQLLGVRAIIAESFERIHRTNLVGMGILPLQFLQGQNAESLGLKGNERYSVKLRNGNLLPGEIITVEVKNGENNKTNEFNAKCRIDTDVEVGYFKNGGILPFVLRKLAKNNNSEKQLEFE